MRSNKWYMFCMDIVGVIILLLLVSSIFRSGH